MRQCPPGGSAFRQDVGMPRAREIGIRIGDLPTGPTNSVLDVRRRRPRPRHGRPRRAGATRRPRLGAHRRHHPAPGRGRLPPAAGGGRRRAQRGRRVHRLPDRARVGHDRDPGLPHLDDAARPRLRRRLPDRARAAPRRGRRRGDPGRRRVRRLLPQRLPADAGRAPTDVRARRTTRPLASRGAATPPAEGAVGAGTGMSCLGFKGGIGTSSRVTPAGHTVAVLLLTNFGERAAADRRRRARSGGCCRRRTTPAAPPAGSCIGVVVTDAPVDARRLRAARPPDRARAGPDRARPPTTAAARSSWPPRPRCRIDRDGTPEAGPRVAGRGARRPVRGRRRRRRGVGAQLAARLGDRPRSAATATPARGSTRRVSRGCWPRQGHAGH